MSKPWERPSPIEGMTEYTYDSFYHHLIQLDGRTVGLLAYSSNTSWDRDKNKYLVLAEDLYSKWEIRYIVEVSDMAFLSLWHNGVMVGDEVSCWADDAPAVAVTKILKRKMKEEIKQ